MEFEALAQSLLGQINYLLPAWLPGGKTYGKEYKCGSLKGGKGDSLSVNTETGAWADFAVAGVKGGDLISLYAAIENLRQGDAFRILAEKHSPGIIGTTPTQRKNEIIPVAAPTSADKPPMIHPQYGPPTTSWAYKDMAGNILFYIARYDIPKCTKCGTVITNGMCLACGAKAGKELLPWCWVDKQKSFKSVGWPAPRPIYGLEQLGEKPVIIVEGEKACEAARKILNQEYTVITWPNGTNAVRKVDWTPLSGRSVILWPDADEVGVKSAHSIADQLKVICPEVKIIEPEGKSGGWDAADAVGDGWGYDEFIAWAKPRVKTLWPSATPLDAEVLSTSTEQEANLPSSVYGMWEKFGIAMSSNNQPICNIDNVMRIFDGSPEFVDFVWYDEFHKKYFTKWLTNEPREWSDIDELNLTAFFQRELGLSRMGDEMVHKAAMIFAHKHKRNEPLDWMRSIVWDGKSRIQKFFVYYMGAEDSEYSDAVSKNFWISMVARIFRPGEKVDTMVMLEGKQGKFKSTALSVIGGDWYAESHEQVGTPNFFQALMGKMVIEISELDSFGKAEINTIKRVVSCPVDRLRLPYARSTQDFARQCVFVGTTNEHVYLKDGTGARRFWPMQTGRISIQALRDDREQLFAEAVHCLLRGDTWWEVPEQALEIQESRRESDEWEPVVFKYLEAHNNGEFGHIISEIAYKALNIRIDKLDIIIQRRIGKVLRSLGYINKCVRRDGHVSRIWVKPDDLELSPTT